MKKETPYDEPLRDDQTIVCSVSGGKDSTALALYFLHEAGLPNPLRFVFADTDWEHPVTYEYLDTLQDFLGVTIDRVKPELGFVALAAKKKRFPSPRVRFCTEELKIKPLAKYVDALIDANADPVVAVGIRAEESASRARMSEWGYSGAYDAPIWRPLLKWSAGQVFGLHQKHKCPPNPLYKRGHGRVGCWPCIMCRKGELAHSFREDDVMIERLRDAEKRVAAESPHGLATFFTQDKAAQKYRNITWTRESDGQVFTMADADGVRLWALDGDQPELDFGDEPPSCFSQYGLCE